jgi:hypothetical protein
MAMGMAWGIAPSSIPIAVAGMDTVASTSHANSISARTKREERMRCMANAKGMHASISPPKTMLNDSLNIAAPMSIELTIDSRAGQDFLQNASKNSYPDQIEAA